MNFENITNVDNYLQNALKKDGYIDSLLNEISILEEQKVEDETIKYWWLGFLFLKFYPQFQFDGNPEWSFLFPVTVGWYIYNTSFA